jgi:hypothetical protein
VVRTIAVSIISVSCLMFFASCDDISSSSSLVGDWGGPAGQSMIFYPNGRVAIRDANGVVPNATYQYDAMTGVVKITRPEGAGVLEGVAITKVRLEFKGRHGKPLIFNRRGT